MKLKIPHIMNLLIVVENFTTLANSDIEKTQHWNVAKRRPVLLTTSKVKIFMFLRSLPKALSLSP